MTNREAFEAMFLFLDERYSRLPSDALGQLLSELQLASDGRPFDPAIAQEWDEAVQRAKKSVESTSIAPLRRAS